MRIKLASWNVNGLRAIVKKPEFQWFYDNDYDIVGLQEIKADSDQIPVKLRNLPDREAYFASSVVKKGYSGTAVFSKIKSLSHEIELPDPDYQGEGRIIHLEFEQFHFFNGYFPNGGAEVLDDNGKPIPGEFKRVPYKMGFFKSFLRYAEELRRQKPIVVCGDFNIAHKEIDLARPRQNMLNTGFLQVERDFFDAMLGQGYIDTFRLINGDVPERYSWWSYKMRAREKNVGWRIDYFLVSEELKSHVTDAVIENEVRGSDHCPVGLTLEF